ncbi:MAG: DNA mismatch repair protein MutS, partial [Bacteroidales bacterium]|nr:DNA mismatch repair protein MutS [Bacteroidales bacterium]
DNVLDNRENNVLASVFLDRQFSGVSFLDISTGEFLTSQGDRAFIDKLLSSFNPKEVLIQKSYREGFFESFGEGYYTFPLDDWVYTEDNAREKLQRQFGTQNLKGFGIHDMGHGIIASGAILQYLDLTQHSSTSHITRLSRIERDHYVWLDRFTIRNLEIFSSLYEGARTLLDVMDQTVTPMGSRLLRRWLSLPLKDVLLIRERHNMVEYIKEGEEFREFLGEQIKQIGDLERIISKVAAGRIMPRELVQLKNALTAIDPLKKQCEQSGEVSLQKISDQLDPCHDVKDRIEKEIENEPPALLSKGGVMATGVSEELDELREIMYSGKGYLVKLQQREMERTGITSLKVGFNNVFGYYIEVRNTHKDKVPEEWTRKQTLVSAERY